MVRSFVFCRQNPSRWRAVGVSMEFSIKTFVVHLALSLIIASFVAGDERVAAQIPAQDARNTNIVTTNTHLPLPQFTSLNAWEARKAFLRKQILVAAGLSPLPE